MSQSNSQKRPWLAAVLGVVATGFGHLYLRRWRRGLAWVGVLFGVTVLFVEPAAVETIANWDAADPLAVAPVFIVGSLSVVDAYLLAHVQNAVAQVSIAPDEQRTHCPNCRRELDLDLAFCHWCTTDITDLDTARPNERNQ